MNMKLSITDVILKLSYFFFSVLTGTKLPGPASKTGVAPLGKGATQTGKGGAGNTSGKGTQSQGKGGGTGAKVSAQSQVSIFC